MCTILLFCYCCHGRCWFYCILREWHIACSVLAAIFNWKTRNSVCVQCTYDSKDCFNEHIHTHTHEFALWATVYGVSTTIYAFKSVVKSLGAFLSSHFKIVSGISAYNIVCMRCSLDLALCPALRTILVCMHFIWHRVFFYSLDVMYRVHYCSIYMLFANNNKKPTTTKIPFSISFARLKLPIALVIHSLCNSLSHSRAHTHTHILYHRCYFIVVVVQYDFFVCPFCGVEFKSVPYLVLTSER